MKKEKGKAKGANFCRKGAICFVCMVFLTLLLPLNAQASSWTKYADTSIYDQGESREVESEEEPDPSSFEKKISKLFRNLAGGLNGLLIDNSCDLDYIICGRVNSGGAQTALFTFELRGNNPYGTIAAVTYTALRGVMFVIVACIFLTHLVKGQYTGGNARARDRMKDAVITTIIGFCSLILMPYIYDVFLYLRDVFLFAVLEQMKNYTGEMGLIASFKSVAEETQLFSDALVYLGAVGVTLFYAFEYIGMALASVVLFVSFTFVVMLMFFDKSRLSNWIMQVMSIVLTPVIDYSLLTIPAFMEIVSPGHPVLKLIIIMLIKPARNLFKQALGLNSPGAGLMNGMAGFAMMQGAIMAARGGASAASNIRNKIDGAISDRRKSKYYEDMEEAELKDMEEAEGGFAGIGADGNNGELAYVGNGFGIAGAEKDHGEAENAGVMDGVYTGDGLSGEFGIAGVEKDHGDIEDTDYVRNDRNAYGYQGYGNYNEAQMQAERDVLTSENDQHRENISALEQYNAKLESDNAVMELQDSQSGIPEHAGGISANRVQIAKNRVAISKEKAEISRNNSKINGIDRMMSGVSAKGYGASYGKSQMSPRQMEVLRKHANIDNFEEPEFRNLDHAAKAQLYRERSKKRMAQAVGMTVGGVGGMSTFGSIAAGATMFYGASTSAAIAGAAINVGARGGTAVGSAAGKVVYNVTSELNRAATHPIVSKTTSVPGASANIDVTTVLADNVKNLMNQEVVVKGYEAKAESNKAQSVNSVVRAQSAGMKENITLRQQVENVVSNPAAKEVIASFCQEMIRPGSTVMERYEKMASRQMKNNLENDEIHKRVAGMMSKDIMDNLASKGVDVGSPDVYKTIRSNVERRIGNVLSEWNTME